MTRIVGPNGFVFEVEQTVAEGLVDGGHARYVADAPADADEPEGAVPDTAPSAPTVTEMTAEAEPPVTPKGNASAEEWGAYATAHGKDIAGLSRDEIRALFKE